MHSWILKQHTDVCWQNGYCFIRKSCKPKPNVQLCPNLKLKSQACLCFKIAVYSHITKYTYSRHWFSQVKGTFNFVPRVFSLKYPGYGWSRVYVCQSKPHRGWVLDLILSTLSREVNVALLYRRYSEKEASYLLEILPDQCFVSTWTFVVMKMLTEREFCLYFTASFFN